ncbi:MAG: hypothetical protein JXA54_08165 [Candidatus Heimdallarchaeota archaeon]|nr:hypothetical protein [Candidatus Heimdallarchaeota archaeon]
MNETRFTKFGDKEKQLAISNRMIFVSSIIIIITFCFFLIRRWLVIIDAILGQYGNPSGLNNFITYRGNLILRDVTITFDLIQFLGILCLFIGFIFLAKKTSNVNQKKVIFISTPFGIILLLYIARIIVLHYGTANDSLNFIILGSLSNDLPSSIYSYAFFVYSTDTLRIIIAFLTLLSTILFIKYLKHEYGNQSNFSYLGSIFFGAFILSYIIISVVGSIYYNTQTNIIPIEIDITMYSLHYIFHDLLQIGHIVVYTSYIKWYMIN